MALMERVATLLRANVNEMVARAERPERLLKQLLLDMENQLLQVKTQVALLMADGRQLERTQAEHATAAEGWRGRAAMAVDRGRDDLAREALERALSEGRLAEQFAEQLREQREEAELMRGTFRRLETKLVETRGRAELLLEEQRRARMAATAVADARTVEPAGVERRLRGEIADLKGRAEAGRALLGGAGRAASVEEEFAEMERDEQVEALLRELKGTRGLPERAS